MKFMKNNKKAFIGAAAVLSIVLTGGIVSANLPKTINLTVDEEVKTIQTSSKTVEELIKEQGFDLANIKVYEKLDKKIKNNETIEIDTKKEVQFTNKGTSLNITTFANDVKSFLKENDIYADEHDIITPHQNKKITDGEQIKFDDVEVEKYKKNEKVAFSKKKEYSFDMELGKSKLKTKGVNGLNEVTMEKTFVNGKKVSDLKIDTKVIKKVVNEVTLIGSKEVVEKNIENEVETIKNSDMYDDETNVIQEGEKGIKKLIYDNRGKNNRKLISEKIVKKPIKRIVEVGTKEKPSTSSDYLYSLSEFQFNGVVYWGGYKYTYYSQSVLPGGGLSIPGRHVNDGGYVADADGYIVLANDAPRGTIIPTPFGYLGKVYDRGTYGNHIDVYTR